MRKLHEEYNGWHNRATWGCALILDNERALYARVQELIKQSADFKTFVAKLTAFVMNRVLVYERSGGADMGLAGDVQRAIVKASLSSINFPEIAASLWATAERGEETPPPFSEQAEMAPTKAVTSAMSSPKVWGMFKSFLLERDPQARAAAELEDTPEKDRKAKEIAASISNMFRGLSDDISEFLFDSLLPSISYDRFPLTSQMLMDVQGMIDWDTVTQFVKAKRASEENPTWVDTQPEDEPEDDGSDDWKKA